MPIVRDRQHDRIDIGASHHFVIVVVSFAISVAVLPIDCVEGGLKMIFVDIARGDDLAIFECQERVGVTRPLHSPSYDSQCYTFGWRGLRATTQRTRWNNRRSGDSESGCGDKTTAANA